MNNKINFFPKILTMKLLYFPGEIWIPASRKVSAALDLRPRCQAGGEEREEWLGFRVPAELEGREWRGAC